MADSTGKNGEEKQRDDELKQKRHRSPNYPSMGLREAVELARTLDNKYRRSPVPVNLVHTLWGFKEHSANGNQAVAALKSFGLITVSGEAKARQIQLHEDGQHISRNGPSTALLLKSAALKPPIYSELWEKYKDDGLPDDSLMRHYLEWDRKEGTFNKDVIDAFIADFKDSLAFANIAKDDIIHPAGDGSLADDTNKIKVGDFVQWTVNGSDQFVTPFQIRGISDDGKYAFVAESLTGLPMDQLTKQSPPVETPADPPANPFFKGAGETTAKGQVEEKKIFDEGIATLRWPDKLSKESVEEFDYWVQGVLKRLRRHAGLN